MMTKKMLIRGLVGLALAGFLGCQSQTPIKPVVKKQPETKIIETIPKKVSYKLEDFLDTPIKQRDIKLNVYIQDSENIWNYREHKDEIFGYVKDFFREHKINCKISYYKDPMQENTTINEFGLEILGSTKQMNKRRLELILGKIEVSDSTMQELNKIIKIENNGYAYAPGNICIIDGSYDILMNNLGRKPSFDELEKKYNEDFQGISIQEAIIRNDAALICHEVLHCMGLFHPDIFATDFFDKYQKIKDCPDIMIMDIPRFDVNKQGYCLSGFQEAMMQSYLAGNNVYKAFTDSGKQFLPYLQRIHWANNLKLK